MTQEVQFCLNLLAACLMRQHQALERVHAQLDEVLDRVDSVGDCVWRLDTSLKAANVSDGRRVQSVGANRQPKGRRPQSAPKQSGKRPAPPTR